MKNYALLFLSILFIFSSCKKYSEDDRRYLKTPCTRFYGKWQIDKIINEESGEDTSADTVFYSTQTGMNTWIKEYYIPKGIIFNFKGKGGRFFCYDVGANGVVTSDNAPMSSSSYFEFRRKKTDLKFDLKPNDHTSARYLFNDYKIKKLTDDELVIGRGIINIYFIAK